MKRYFASFLLLFFIWSSVMPLKAQAVEFDPSFILTNFDMEDFESMTLADIQTFLELNNSYLANHSFKDVYGVTRPASEIIYNASRTHYINPKWILVTLQKEQSLINDPFPSQDQLDWAMGYAVCDTCSKSDPGIQKFKGFGRQVDRATARVRYYITNPLEFYFQPGLVRTIDGVDVAIKNMATAVLYNYTPHLHGNRNFWRLWSQWFSKVYPDGSLLQVAGEPGVWLIQNGQKRAFLNKVSLVSRFDPNDIIQVSKIDLSQYPTGFPIKYPNYSLVKGSADDIYLLVGDQKKRIASDEVFKKLGFNPLEVEQIPDFDLEQYEDGREITLASVYPLGQLIQDVETGGVYYVQDGFKHPIVSPEILKVNFPNMKIIKGDKQTLDGFITAQKVRFFDGKLVKSPDSPVVYVISNGTRRPIANEKTFNTLGYDWGDIITTTQAAINLHPLGPELNLDFGGDKLEVTTP